MKPSLKHTGTRSNTLSLNSLLCGPGLFWQWIAPHGISVVYGFSLSLSDMEWGRLKSTHLTMTPPLSANCRMLAVLSLFSEVSTALHALPAWLNLLTPRFAFCMIFLVHFICGEAAHSRSPRFLCRRRLVLRIQRQGQSHQQRYQNNVLLKDTCKGLPEWCRDMMCRTARHRSLYCCCFFCLTATREMSMTIYLFLCA